MLASFISLGLRLGGVAGKFVAILALARLSGAAEVGEFTLFFSAINVLVFVVGLDFHLFVFREVLARRTSAGQLRIILGHQLLNLGVYVVLLTAGSLVVWVAGGRILELPLVWLIAILITDHAAQELSRIFVALSRPTHANVIYVVKTGAWAWLGAVLGLTGHVPLNAETFYPLWFAANIIAIVYGVVALTQALGVERASLPSRYGRWVLHGIRVSSFFYATSVATSALGALDRFVIAGSHSVSATGLYSFWQSAASLIPIAAYAMVGMHILPHLVRAYQRGSWVDFAELHHNFLARSLWVSIPMAGLLVVAAPIATRVMGLSEIEPSILLVGLLAFTAVMTTLWQVPFQVLYSGRNDALLAGVLVSTAVLSFLLNLLVVPAAGVLGAAAIGAAANLGLYVVLAGKARRLLARAGDSPDLCT
jgi:O-antigen/teichoic acid export membrane protein